MPSFYRFRSRNIDVTDVAGKRVIAQTYYSNGTPLWGTPWYSTAYTAQLPRTAESCHDYVQNTIPYDDHPLSHVKKQGKPARFTYETCNPLQKPLTGWQFCYQYNDWADQRVRAYTGSGVPQLPPASWGLYTTSAIAQLNAKLKPSVDLPLFLWELLEFPRMLRDLGRYKRKELTAQDVPGAFLSYNFGWAPMVSDLWSMLQLAQATEQQLKNLLSARLGKEFRGGFPPSENLDYGVHHTVPFHDTTSEKFIVETRSTYREKVWYTAKLENLNQAAMHALLETLTSNPWKTAFYQLGLTQANASTLWNAIPWSWLIDYFINVGSYLDAINGNVPFKVKSLCLMMEQEMRETDVIKVNTLKLPYKYKPHVFTFTGKNRIVMTNPTPVMTFKPFLNGKQKAILGALGLASVLR